MQVFKIKNYQIGMDELRVFDSILPSLESSRYTRHCVTGTIVLHVNASTLKSEEMFGSDSVISSIS